MYLSEEELVIFMILAYGGMYPSIRGIQSVLPMGIDNVLKWKNQIEIDKIAKKQKKKFQSQGLWWGKEEFEKKIMPVAVHELEVAFRRKEKYLQTFFQSSYGYAIIEFRENGVFVIRQVECRNEWMKELREYSEEFIKNTVNSIMITNGDLDKSNTKIYIREFVNSTDTTFELQLCRQDKKIIYNKREKGFFLNKKVKEKMELCIDDIDELLRQEIILEGEK